MLYESHLISTASGKLSGLVASHNRGGQYMRAYVIPTDPDTVQQGYCRDGLAAANAEWVSMTPDERTAWDNFARTQSRTNALGQVKSITGRQAFQGYYVPQYQRVAALDVGGTVQQFAPTAPPADFDRLRIDLTSTSNLQLRWDPDPMLWQSSNAQEGIVIHISPVWEQTKHWYRGPYQPAIWIEGDEDDPITAPYDATIPVPFRPASGQVLFVRARLLYNDTRPHGRNWSYRLIAP